MEPMGRVWPERRATGPETFKLRSPYLGIMRLSGVLRAPLRDLLECYKGFGFRVYLEDHGT